MASYLSVAALSANLLLLALIFTIAVDGKPIKVTSSHAHEDTTVSDITSHKHISLQNGEGISLEPQASTDVPSISVNPTPDSSNGKILINIGDPDNSNNSSTPRSDKPGEPSILGGLSTPSGINSTAGSSVTPIGSSAPKDDKDIKIPGLYTVPGSSVTPKGSSSPKDDDDDDEDIKIPGLHSTPGDSVTPIGSSSPKDDEDIKIPGLSTAPGSSVTPKGSSTPKNDKDTKIPENPTTPGIRTSTKISGAPTMDGKSTTIKPSTTRNPESGVTMSIPKAKGCRTKKPDIDQPTSDDDKNEGDPSGYIRGEDQAWINYCQMILGSPQASYLTVISNPCYVVCQSPEESRNVLIETGTPCGENQSCLRGWCVSDSQVQIDQDPGQYPDPYGNPEGDYISSQGIRNPVLVPINEVMNV